ncbi:MAG TPA: nucleotidyltransferase domain-containing protein [Chryseosolibacter sp.]
MRATKNHTNLGEQVLMTLMYFDIFSYPLKAAEVFNFLRINSASVREVTECLHVLAQKQAVFRFGDLYSLHPENKDIIRRLKGNAEAAKCLKVAEKQARFIARFPYVESVMVSGSLSKGYMDETSDLDFFIITSANRLWIARTLLVLYKRIFLFNSHKRFCVNYFIDCEHLEIEEKNLFTATELVTLIPLYNSGSHRALMKANAWVLDFFPNYNLGQPPKNEIIHRGVIKGFLELIFSPLSHWLDRLFMQMTMKRWNKMYGEKYVKEDFDIAFKTRRHVSKNHPRYYQKKILERYQVKLYEFRNRLDYTDVA